MEICHKFFESEFNSLNKYIVAVNKAANKIKTKVERLTNDLELV